MRNAAINEAQSKSKAAKETSQPEEMNFHDSPNVDVFGDMTAEDQEGEEEEEADPVEDTPVE